MSSNNIEQIGKEQNSKYIERARKSVSSDHQEWIALFPEALREHMLAGVYLAQQAKGIVNIGDLGSQRRTVVIPGRVFEFHGDAIGPTFQDYRRGFHYVAGEEVIKAYERSGGAIISTDINVTPEWVVPR